MKKLLIIFLFFSTPLFAEKIERLGFYNLQEILQDDNLTYKIIKGCVSLNTAVTEIIKEEYPDLANEFFQSANYLYPFGILVLKKIKKIDVQAAEKEYFFTIDNLTKDYMNFMRKNGLINQSFFKGTFLGDDLNFCNEIRAAIETTITESKNK
tara:strand:+ start:2879 stop:3337 length:459 start_codon:yes stop_codon:yes gene_type:complete